MAGIRVVLKVAVLGEQKTGKSSLITRYVDGKLPVGRQKEQKEPTAKAGMDFRQKTVLVVGQEYSCEIWDVPNWTVLENLGLNFWKDISGCAVVFDVTKASSFCILDQLYSSLHNVLKKKDAPMVVVGTMADRVPSLREVSAEMAESWCRKVGTSYFEVSAQTGSGVTEMFMALAEKAVLFYHHHHPSSQLTTAKSSRFSVQRPFLKKVTSKLRFKRREETPKPDEEGATAAENLEDVDTSTTSPLASISPSLPISFRVPWVSKKAAEGDNELLKQVQRQLEVEESRAKMLQEKVNKQESELEESVLVQKRLRRNLSEKEVECERLQSRSHVLEQEVAELQQKMHQASSHWEVKREEVELHKTEIIGTGAWGYVVEGTFRGQRVAVKCLHNLIRQPHFIKQVRREIDIMAQLRHPHLLLFMGVVVEQVSSPLIVTELLDTSLRRAYEQNQLQQSNIVGIFKQVASALNYLHLQSSGIIHRDVSSANVLLEGNSEQQWKAKLSDFGSANLMRQSSTVGPGAIVYAAPEIKTESGIPQTPKVDVYSFGVLLAEVLLNQFPSVEEFPAMLETVRVVWPSAYPLTYTCTKEDPSQRPTMAQVLEQLNQLTLTN